MYACFSVISSRIVIPNFLQVIPKTVRFDIKTSLELECLITNTERTNFKIQIDSQFDSSDCFELMIRKNTRSCTRGKLIITSNNYYVHNTLCFLRLINSKHSEKAFR